MNSIFSSKKEVTFNNKEYSLKADETFEGTQFLSIESEDGEEMKVSREGNVIRKDYSGYYSYDRLPKDYKGVLEKVDEVEIK